MSAARHKTLRADVTVDDLFEAVLYTVQQAQTARGKALYGSSGVSHEIKETIFATRWTPLSWGSAFIASVVPDGAGAVLQVTTDRIPDAPTALLDGWQNGKAADKFIAQVQETLAMSPRPKPEPVESWQYAPDGSVVAWTTRDLS